MGTPASRIPLLPSLIDRLIDREPRNRNEAASAQTHSLREVKNSLRRDLEWLLNTRRTPEEPDASARELWRSVYCYGLPDVSALPLSHVEGQQRLVRLLEAAIAAFEPRLTNVSVVLLPVAAQAKLLRFRIEALLRMEPAPERIFFDTTLELASGHYEVEADARAR